MKKKKTECEAFFRQQNQEAERFLEKLFKDMEIRMESMQVRYGRSYCYLLYSVYSIHNKSIEMTEFRDISNNSVSLVALEKA